MKLSDKIYEYRKINGWSQEELAEKLEVSRQTISKWEVGKAVPELDKLIKLSELFNIKVDDLVKDEIDIISRNDETETSESDCDGKIENASEELVENISNESNPNSSEKIVQENENKNDNRKSKTKEKLKIAILIILLMAILVSIVDFTINIKRREYYIKEIVKVYNDEFKNIGYNESAFVTETISKNENNVISETKRHYYIYADEDGKRLVKIQEYEDADSQNLIKEIYVDLSKMGEYNYRVDRYTYNDVIEINTDDWSHNIIDGYDFISPIDRVTNAMNSKYSLVDSIVGNEVYNAEEVALDFDNEMHVLKRPSRNTEIFVWIYGNKNNSKREDYLDLYMLPISNWMSFYFDNYENDIAQTREIVSMQITKIDGCIDDVTVPEL